MSAESTPIRGGLKILLSEVFKEITPVRFPHSDSKRRKLCKRIKCETVKEDEGSDDELLIRSQVLSSDEIQKSTENEKKRTGDKRTFVTENDSKYQHNSDDLFSENENSPINIRPHISNTKLHFADSLVDKALVDLNYDVEKKVNASNKNQHDKESNSKLSGHELASESLSTSDVMKWSSTSCFLQDNEPYFSNFIKKKLLHNASNKDVIKSQTTGWTQYQLLPDEGSNLFKDQGCNKKENKSQENDSCYGLPCRIKELYMEQKGIKSLFDWQNDCLNLDAVKEKRNLIYSLPTSGGKSLVAEILILKEVLVHKKDVLLVLPYVSIVQEKIRDFAQLALDLNFALEEYAAGKGVIPPKKRKRKNSLIVATIEKGLIVVNSLIEEKRLEEFGLVVVDELHLLSEEGRGSTLESLLIQILHCGAKIQIIGMTATIGNLDEVAKFLKADSYCKDFRPVHLSEYVKCENKVYLADPKSTDLLKEVRSIEPTCEGDPDGIGYLVQEVIPEDSVLIFCPTKKNCENVSILLSHCLPRSLLKHKEEEKKSLIVALVTEMNDKLCPTLKQTLPYGLAYHHSGLTAGERKLLEEGFRQGTLSVLCCTSTLAVGVNLPAKRVILRSPFVAKDFISLSKYKQMVGRAGRTGFGSNEGESFLICQPAEKEKVLKLFQSHMDEVISKMDSQSSKDLILHSIGLRTATSKIAIRDLLKRSLLHLQSHQSVKQIADECVDALFSQGALVVKNQENKCMSEDFGNNSENEQSDNKETEKFKIADNAELTISKLGCAAMKGGLPLEAAHELYEELMKAQADMVLFTSLHMLYLVIPHDLVSQIRPNCQIFFEAYSCLDRKEVHAAQIIGITECIASKIAMGVKPKSLKTAVFNKFYIALILNELWNQKTVWDVAQLFQLPRGFVQTVMTSAATFANCVLRFCEELPEFWPFKSLLCEFAPRLAYCCSPEILPLMELPAVKKGRAKQLYNAGFRTLEIIACSQPEDIMRSVDHMPRTVATQIVAAAKLMLTERAENLQEEAERVLDALSKKVMPCEK